VTSLTPPLAQCNTDPEDLMPKRVLRPPNLTFLPKPEYPYSPGTTGGGLVYTAGQVAWDDHGELVGRGDPAAQTRQVLANVESVLREAGATLEDVLKCTVYLADIRYFQAMNGVFAEVFPTEPPARTTVQAALAEPEMLVEIEAIAWIGE
jgi:2-iminobutanoate/2-iminopropanoate deaminase